MRAWTILAAVAAMTTGVSAQSSSSISSATSVQQGTMTITKTLVHVTATTTMTSYRNTASVGFQNLTTTATSYSRNPSSLTAVASSTVPVPSVYRANGASAQTINIVGAAIAGVAALGLGML